MKKDIHPKYHNQAAITCACGNNFVVGSTMKEIRVELCNLCHPFYTGKQKFVDTARRVEKFQEKLAITKKTATARKGKKVKHAARAKKREITKAEIKKVDSKKKKKAAEKKTVNLK
ncbi:MAG: 50S ribosomal protein L31 [Patescibacteria group bacterium]